MTTIAILDKAGFRSMGPPSDVQVGGLARRFLKDPANWANSTRTGDRNTRVLDALKRKLPQALDLFPEHLLLAVAKLPVHPLCEWDSARVMAALAGEPEPTNTEAVRELLGRPCQRCTVRLNIAAARRRTEAQAAAARKVLQLIQAEDGALAERVAFWGLQLDLPTSVVADVLTAAAPAQGARRVSAPTPTAARPAAAHSVRPGTPPSYYRKRPVRWT